MKPWDMALKVADPVLYRQLSAGKLWQVCPQCKRNEAAGPHCGGCGGATGPADWFPNAELSKELAARGAQTEAKRRLEKRQTHPNRGKGRPRRGSAA